jgi:hypothetical protein
VDHSLFIVSLAQCLLVGLKCALILGAIFLGHRSTLDQCCRSVPPPPVRTPDPRSERERPGTALPAALRAGASRNRAPGRAPDLPNRAPELKTPLPALSRTVPLPRAPDHPEPRSRSAPKPARALPENEPQKVKFFWFF